MFVSSEEKKVDFKGHSLIIPSPESHGEAATCGTDLTVINHGFEHVGHFVSEHIIPLCGNDILSTTEPTGKLVVPNEVYSHPEKKVTVFAFRSGVSKGRLQEFVDEIEKWFTDSGFENLIILTSTYNPVRKIRVSNAQIPKLFYYENIHFGKGSFVDDL